VAVYLRARSFAALRMTCLGGSCAATCPAPKKNRPPLPMPPSPSEIESPRPALEAFLLGQVDFDVTLALQQRLVAQSHERGDGQVTLLLCEHPPLITVGRGGVPGDVAMQSNLVRSRQIAVRWANRGGGCLMHCPGQLAIYPIVPLRWHGFSIGAFLHRLQSGIIAALDDLNVPSRAARDAQGPAQAVGTDVPQDAACPRQAVPTPLLHGVWGRTGQLAALGVAVRHWITYYGAYLNVCPPLGLFRLVNSDPQTQSPMSCLVAERCGPVKMTGVRAALVCRLAERFNCDRYHLYTGHPLLRRVARNSN
jgi:lipoyl(octanoyl) transferase